MTIFDMKDLLGINTIRKVSDRTTVVEYKDGSAFPASPLEIRMWDLLQAYAGTR